MAHPALLKHHHLVPRAPSPSPTSSNNSSNGAVPKVLRALNSPHLSLHTATLLLPRETHASVLPLVLTASQMLLLSFTVLPHQAGTLLQDRASLRAHPDTSRLSQSVLLANSNNKTSSNSLNLSSRDLPTRRLLLLQRSSLSPLRTRPPSLLRSPTKSLHLQQNRLPLSRLPLLPRL